MSDRDNPYAQFTPEARVWHIAQGEHGLTDEELLTQAGWVPHDGTDMRRDLIHQYHDSAGPSAFTEGLKLHAMDWAASGMRADLDTAAAYGDHIVDLHRAGDLTVHTSHKNAYPRWLEAREAAQAAGVDAEAQ